MSNPVSLSAVRDIRIRINATALVHRGFYEGKDLRAVDMPVHLNRLVSALRRELGRTNALKHGVKPVGTINIEMNNAEGCFYISVSDDNGGVGAASVKGTGAKFMRGLFYSQRNLTAKTQILVIAPK